MIILVHQHASAATQREHARRGFRDAVEHARHLGGFTGADGQFRERELAAILLLQAHLFSAECDGGTLALSDVPERRDHHFFAAVADALGVKLDVQFGLVGPQHDGFEGPEVAEQNALLNDAARSAREPVEQILLGQGGVIAV